MTAYGYGDKITNTNESNAMEGSFYSDMVSKTLNELCHYSDNRFSFCEEHGYKGDSDNRYSDNRYSDNRYSDKGDSDKGDSGKGDSGKGDSGKGDSGKGDNDKGDNDNEPSDNRPKSVPGRSIVPGISIFTRGKGSDEKGGGISVCGVGSNITVGKGNDELDFGGGGRCFGGGGSEHGGGSCLTF